MLFLLTLDTLSYTSYTAGSMPPNDAARSRVYFATGELYRVPREFTECQIARNNAAGACGPPDNHVGLVGLL